MMIKNILRYFPILIMALLPYLNTPVLHAHIYDSLEFQTITQFSGIQATVSSQPSDSAEFSTLKAAIDAGNKAIRIVGNTVETAAATLLPDCDYLIVIDANASLDFASFNLLYAATGTGSFEQRLYMRGEGKVVYAFAAINNRLFKRNGRSVILDVETLDIQNDSTADDCSISDADVILIHNIFFDLPAQDKGGIVTSDDDRNRVDGLTFFGGTSGTSRALSILNNGFYTNIIFKGTYKGSFTEPYLEVTDLSPGISGTVLENINVSDAVVTSGTFRMSLKGTLKNFIAISGTIKDINITIPFTIISGVTATNLKILLSSADFCKLSNITLRGIPANSVLSLINAGAAQGNSFTNLSVERISSIDGNFNKFDNCTVGMADDDVVITGDNNSFSNCQFGPLAGGGVEGVIITGTADSTIITGSLLDIAISDSGTGTSLANNVIY